VSIHLAKGVVDIIAVQVAPRVRPVDAVIYVNALVVKPIVMTTVTGRQLLATSRPPLERVTGTVNTAVGQVVAPAGSVTLLKLSCRRFFELKEVMCA
jgi:hypothetical protein